MVVVERGLFGRGDYERSLMQTLSLGQLVPSWVEVSRLGFHELQLC